MSVLHSKAYARVAKLVPDTMRLVVSETSPAVWSLFEKETNVKITYGKAEDIRRYFKAQAGNNKPEQKEKKSKKKGIKA